MDAKTRQSISEMEHAIITWVKKALGKNLVSLFTIGSYANYDIVPGYSDYDLLAMVKKEPKTRLIKLDTLSKKYSLDIGCSFVSYVDFLNRIKNNNKATRFVGNISLMKMRKKARLLTGKNIQKLIPSLKELMKRDLNSELMANYYHATSTNPEWNIFKREPCKWINYIISMSNDILISKGIFIEKNEIPKMLNKYCPDFKGTQYVKEALRLRQTKKVLDLNKKEKIKIKNTLSLFLEKYKNHVS
jgi:hypothetical protein